MKHHRKAYRIGLEYEAPVITNDNEESVSNFTNTPLFNKINQAFKDAGFKSLHTEFDASIIEIALEPLPKLSDAFEKLVTAHDALNQLLAQEQMKLSHLSIAKHRSYDDLIMTNSPRAQESIKLMADSGRFVCYAGFQINLEVPTDFNDAIITICHALQAIMWPFTIITQSSALFDNRTSQYHSYRTCLNDAISRTRSGPLPLSIKTLADLKNYSKYLPHEASLLRKNNLWFDILPKELIDSDGYRLEIRAADNSSLDRLHKFSEAIIMSYDACLNSLVNNKSLPSPSEPWFSINRDAIIKQGITAKLTLDGNDQITNAEYMNNTWKPWVLENTDYSDAQINSVINDCLMPSLSQNILSSKMIFA